MSNVDKCWPGGNVSFRYHALLICMSPHYILVIQTTCSFEVLYSTLSQGLHAAWSPRIVVFICRRDITEPPKYVTHFVPHTSFRHFTPCPSHTIPRTTRTRLTVYGRTGARIAVTIDRKLTVSVPRLGRDAGRCKLRNTAVKITESAIPEACCGAVGAAPR